MTNLQRWRDEILAVGDINKMAIYKGKPCKCDEIVICEMCGLYYADLIPGECPSRVVDWMLAEVESEE